MGVVILQERCNRLRALHIPGTPLVLPNAWDAASARAVVAGGFPVVATTSGGVAEALGYADGERAAAAEVFAARGGRGPRQHPGVAGTASLAAGRTRSGAGKLRLGNPTPVAAEPCDDSRRDPGLRLRPSLTRCPFAAHELAVPREDRFWCDQPAQRRMGEHAIPRSHDRLRSERFRRVG